jgi:hypothetical protein
MLDLADGHIMGSSDRPSSILGYAGILSSRGHGQEILEDDVEDLRLGPHRKLPFQRKNAKLRFSHSYK